MEAFIAVMAIFFVLAYIGFAIWFISKRESIGGSIGASVGFLCGGFIIIPLAKVIATFVCWVIVIAVILAIIGAFSGV